jgi:tryptophan synthase beta subunit
MGSSEILCINLSGRGDKDVSEVERVLGEMEGGAE